MVSVAGLPMKLWDYKLYVLSAIIVFFVFMQYEQILNNFKLLRNYKFAQNEVWLSNITSRLTRRRQRHWFRLEHFVNETIDVNESSDTKTILYWNSFFGREFLASNFTCPPKYGKCVFKTREKNSKNYTADAFLFHLTNLDLNDLPPTKLPDSKELWVLYNYEPPHNEYKDILANVSNNIDLVASYRQDADIFTPYGWMRPRRAEEEVPSRNETEETFNSKGIAVWLVSNCYSNGKRQDYVRELKKYMQVDVFGKCGEPANMCPNRDALSRVQCYAYLAEKYKFYFAFENSICRDYVTEKFFTALKVGMVPVVFGGANLSEVVPAGSYIHAFDFSSPQLLAEHLKKVASNFTLYKDGYGKARTWVCEFCAYLHKGKHELEKKKRDLVKWWLKDSNCAAWVFN